jgi:phenylalanyl-tRNA synthetase beta chain
MKISLNLIKQFTLVEVAIDELVARIGSQLGAVEEVIDIGSKYQGVVVARVVSCEDHPNADRLHICMIDDGGVVPDVARNEDGLVQVVCGAPNVRAEMFVAWLPPGSTVPNSHGSEPFVLEARELRGVVSNGMLASPKELAFGDMHDGILEITEPVSPGIPFADVYELNDYVIDIENKMFTHRPDCFGHLGVAREIAGILGYSFTSPEWYKNTDDGLATVTSEYMLPLVVRNENPELVPRFMAVALSGVEVGPSPFKLQTYLYRLGVRPINNVVDMTNYMMLLTSQPLHAYDYDKVKSIDGNETATLVARLSDSNESLRLLNDKTIKPRAEAIVIATETRAIGLAGVMGGGDTEVDETTKNVLLECATFDMYSIRRTSMVHGLFTDAVTRFNKGQSPAQNNVVTAQTLTMLQELAGGNQASEIFDFDNPARVQYWGAVDISAAFINERLGLDLHVEEIAKLLNNVEFDVVTEGQNLTVSPPFWRTDIAVAEDIVEEVGRLYGYDKLPLVLPRRSLIPASKNPILELKATVRNILSAAGANEVLTYSFVHGNLLEKIGQDFSIAFKLSNALSPSLQYYRISLMPSLLEKIHMNIKAGFNEFALFELGKTHTTKHSNDDPQGLPQEFEVLAFVYAAQNISAKTSPAYYHARRYMDELGRSLGLKLTYSQITDQPDTPIVKPYDLKRSAYIGVEGSKAPLGIIGEFRAEVRKNLKLPERTAGFEINTRELLSMQSHSKRYQPLSKFPNVIQDITLRVGKNTPYAAVYEFVLRSISDKNPDGMSVELEAVDIYQPVDAEYKHITLRLVAVSYLKTLTDAEVMSLLDEVVAEAANTIQAERV